MKLAIASESPLASTKYVVIKVWLPVVPTSLTPTTARRIRKPEEKSKDHLANPLLCSPTVFSTRLLLSCEEVKIMKPQTTTGALQNRYVHLQPTVDRKTVRLMSPAAVPRFPRAL